MPFGVGLARSLFPDVCLPDFQPLAQSGPLRRKDLIAAMPMVHSRVLTPARSPPRWGSPHSSLLPATAPAGSLCKIAWGACPRDETAECCASMDWSPQYLPTNSRTRL